MQRIPLTDAHIAIEGAVGTVATEEHMTLRRLDDRWRHEFPVEVDFLAESPSGVRLAFRTDSSTVGLEFLATMLQTNEEPARPSIFDLVVDGELVASQTSRGGNTLVLDREDPTVFELVPGDVATVHFDLSGRDDQRVELWLPSATVLRVHSLLLDDGAVLTPAPSDQPRWVHHGSSISHCMEAHGGAQVWPAVAARLGDLHLTNLGLGGQCQLDQFTARTMRELPADVLSLKVGINLVNAASMSIRTFPSALHGFLDTVREGHPDTPFLVVSPIICPVHEDMAGPTGPGTGPLVSALGTEVTKAQGALTLRRVRRIVEEVVAVRRGAGDANLHHLDGLAIFGPDDVDDLPDGLHPNGAGYVRMGERFAALAFAAGGPLASAG